MPHILIVCTANICRSPVGEAILKDRLMKRGLTDWQVSSAGTWAQIERGAARYSAQIMAEQGYELEYHRSRMIQSQDLEQADLVLCMESGQAEALQLEFSEYAPKIFLLSGMVNKNYSIQDPYGQPLGAYRDMVGEIGDLIDTGLERIVELAEANTELNSD